MDSNQESTIYIYGRVVLKGIKMLFNMNMNDEIDFKRMWNDIICFVAKIIDNQSLSTYEHIYHCIM